ncbi:pheromone-binding protein-related protein 6-like [Diabrotica undecimpunctata]|uniref:pheromone-binding protein-related protein 6-like n=1 Tax=Diabrotica undecimpunctata TaxID=50387 RepID=UPI003B634ECB
MYIISKMFRLANLFFVVTLVAHFASAVEPTGERAKLAKVLQDACNRRVGISEEEIGKLKAGVFTDDDKSKKYVLCLYQSVKALQVDGDLGYDIIEDVAPPALKPTAREDFKGCFDKQKDSDLGQKLYNTLKCVFARSAMH